MSAIFRHQTRRRSDRHFAGMDRHIYDNTKEPTMRELDAKDREILAILSKEARIPLKTWRDASVFRAVQPESVSPILRKNGVIRGYRADIGQIDRNVIRAMILVSLKRTPALGLLDELARHAEVRRVSSVSGQLDLIVEVEVPTIDRLNSLRDLIATHETVEDLTTAIVLRRDIERETV